MNPWKAKSARRRIFNIITQWEVALVDVDGNDSCRELFSLEIDFVFDKEFACYGYRVYDPDGNLIRHESFPDPIVGKAGDYIKIRAGQLWIDDVWTVEELYEEFY